MLSITDGARLVNGHRRRLRREHKARTIREQPCGGVLDLTLRPPLLFRFRANWRRLPRVGARVNKDGLGVKRLSAFRADHHRIEHLSAALVLMQHGPPPRVDHVDVSPVHDRDDDRIKIEALLR